MASNEQKNQPAKLDTAKAETKAEEKAKSEGTIPVTTKSVKAAVEKEETKPTPKKVAAKKKIKTNKRKAAKKVRTTAKKAAPRKETTMTNFDMNNWFGGYDMPNADKVEELMANAGKQGEEAIAKTRAATEQLADMTRANIEAVVEAGKIATSGAKDLGTELIEDSRNQFEQASDNMRLLAEAKTPAEFMSLQADLAKSSFDSMVSEGSKLTERMVKLAGDAMQPVQNRASVNAEKVKDLMA